MNVQTDINFSMGQETSSLAPLYAALSKAQGLFESVVKKQEGNYGKYANISDGLDMVLPILSDLGVCVMQPFTDTEMVTILAHESGAVREYRVKMVLDSGNRGNATQKVGSTVTYYRRYHLFSILGLATEDEMDAKVADNNAVTPDFKDPQEGLDSLPRGTAFERSQTPAQKAAAAAEAIIAQIKDERIKTPKGLNGVWDRNARYISRLEASYNDEYQNVVDAYDLRLQGMEAEAS